MTAGQLVQENILLLQHAQHVLLLVNGLLIALIGPSKFLPSFHRRMRPYVLAAIGTMVVWTVAHGFWVHPPNVPRWAVGGQMVAMGTFFGLTFYAAKVRVPVIYGAIEIVAGVAGLVLVGFFLPTSSVLALVFATATSFYIIVRGLSNINDALKARSRAAKSMPVPAVGPPPRLARANPYRRVRRKSRKPVKSPCPNTENRS